MRCETCRELLPLFAGGDLTPDVARSVRAHLDHCYYCNETLAEIRDIEDAARAVLAHPVPVSPDAGFSRLLDAILSERRTVSRRAPTGFAGYALAAAAMLLIATGASFLALNGLRAFVAPHSAQQEADARVASVVWDVRDDEAPPGSVPAFPLLAHLERIEEAQFRSPYTAQ